jgi:hypothetical protein
LVRPLLSALRRRTHGAATLEAEVLNHTNTLARFEIMDGLPLPSEFASRLAAIAKRELDTYGGTDEGSSPLKQRIKTYYDYLGFDFQSVEVAWSAVFISFCVRKAGASSSEFKFSARHSDFVFEAIKNAQKQSGVFRGYDYSTWSVRVGDILHHNQPDGTFDFEHAKRHTQYSSHSAIVIARGIDHIGKFAVLVGGNENNTISRRRIALNSNGTAQQRVKQPFISIVKNFK